MKDKHVTFRLIQNLIKTILVFFLSFFTMVVIAQEAPPAPSQFPMIALMGTDGKPFISSELAGKEKSTIVIYLSPICGACAEQTSVITSSMDQMKDVQFLFVTAYSPESTEAFLEDHHIETFENIHFGYDVNLTLQQHYQLNAVPSIYLYNFEGQLSQEWTGYTPVEVLRAAVVGKINSNLLLEKDLKEMWEKVEACPVPTDDQLNTLCIHLDNNSSDEETGLSKYLLTLQRISCAENDPEPLERIKVKKMWDNNAERIKCNLSPFSLANHNILKYAILMPHADFVKELVQTYNVNVDFIDPRDGKTALEFCKEKLSDLEQDKNSDKLEIIEVKKICGYLEESKMKKEAGL